MNDPAIGSGRALFRLAVAVPFFLGAALYLSVIFAAFAALPLVYAHLRFGRVAGILCSLTNMALVFAVSGRMNAAVFFVLAVVLGASIAECAKLKLKVEWNVVFSVGVMLIVSSLLLLSYSHRFNINPVQKLDAFVGTMVEQVANNVEKYKASTTLSSQDLDKFVVDPEMTKRNILFELPSAITITLLIVAVGNLLLLLRLNLQGVRDAQRLESDFFKNWKAPEHMVWPTLVAGFCLVVEIPVLSDVALNIFKVLMAIYAFQGLAIANYLFDVWGVKGFLRPLGYVLAVALLLPLVISLGFFDLWFDFREKFKI
ncbi:MAG: DUF2232 domain-containing protein [Deltaproteobacteria bacterium]|nr:DUF2232 domain-containing protein [Deltaproteobacteria bacterium]